jgi:Mg-chelatase subunit ChlD
MPHSLDDALNDQYLDELLDAIRAMETGFLQARLLSMVLERAARENRLKIRKMLLKEVMYLSQRIAAGTSGTYKTCVTEYRPGLNEIDLERTLEEQLGHRRLESENIYCRERIRQERGYVLLLDVSNSMQKEKIAIGAIATGVFASKLRKDRHGVVAFADDARTIKPMTEANNLEQLMNRMLDIQSGGATNIRKALLKGLEIFEESEHRQKRGIIVTDGRSTLGGDPVEIASKYDRLDVMGLSFGLGGSDPSTNAQMARKGRGRYRYIEKFDDLPMAIGEILSGR